MSRSLVNNNSMKRILILGSSGSGKSILARQLGSTLELPVIHLDRHFWHPGWQRTPHAEWVQVTKKLIARDAWIIDGNYRSTLDLRLKAADTVVFLDLPRWLCVMRAIKRRIEYMNRPRPDIAQGCKERIFDPDFPRFLRHVWNYANRARPDVKRHLLQYGQGKQIIWLRSTDDVKGFLTDPFSNVFRYEVVDFCPDVSQLVDQHPKMMLDLYD